MNPQPNAEVVREVYIQAPPEVVFPYLTDPAKLLLWMGSETSLEPHRGGIFRVVINPERIVLGEYLEVVPPWRIVLSWGWVGREDVPPGSSRVEISLSASGDGTLLRLRHYNLPDQALPLHAKSWEHNLPRLKVALETS